MKKYILLSVVLIVSISLCWLFIVELINYYEFKTLPKQIVNDYGIVYIDPTYLVFYATFLFVPPYVWCVVKLSLWGKDSLGIAVKLLVVTTLLALIIAVPGQLFEYHRQSIMAREHGYNDCPPFTLLSSTHIIKAMVKDLQYCTDDEINSIAKYGYLRELPVVNAYVKEAYVSKE